MAESKMRFSLGDIVAFRRRGCPWWSNRLRGEVVAIRGAWLDVRILDHDGNSGQACRVNAQNVEERKRAISKEAR